MKTFRNLILLGLVVALLVSCAAPKVVEVTRVIKEVVKETVIVAGTPEVVEREVTKIVKEEVTKVVEKVVKETVVVEKVVKEIVVVEAAPEDVNNLFATIEDYESATGETIDSFGESPMLAAMVASGELPPVEERLAKEPAVVRPKVIGQYSDEIRTLGFAEEAGAFSGITEDMVTGLFTLHTSLKFRPQMHADVAKGWELAEDGKSITIYLREGMKWSDGDDFTADDFAFWYEDIVQDPELNPTISDQWMPGDELMGFNVIDDYTVQYTFAIPYWRAIEVFSGGGLYEPEHFLKQYMPKYNDEAEALAKEEGFETWQMAFDFHSAITSDNYDRDLTAPQINPWIIKEIRPDLVIWERNPYFWRVDTAGNQLPYVDTLMIIMTADVKTVGPLKVMAGELDVGGAITGLALTDYPVLKAKEQQGDYKAYLWPRIDQSHAWGFALNYTHKDPVLRELFNDLRFRQALSLAINRDEISEKIFLGLTEPWTAPISAAWTGYEPWMGTYYAEHDVERANALLDEIGLEWDDAQEYRLRPDGKTLFLLGEYCQEWLAYSEDIMDLVALHWKDIGVQFEPKFVFEDILQTAAVANETTMGIGNSDGGSEISPGRSQYPIRLIPPWHWGWDDCCPFAAHPWRWWLDSDGASGIEPPEEIKRAYQLTMEWLDTPYGTDEYERLIKEVIRINVDNLYYFGTVSSPPNVQINSNRLGNAAGKGGPQAGLHHYYNETLFIRQ